MLDAADRTLQRPGRRGPRCLKTFTLLIASSLLYSSLAAAQIKESKRVLILNQLEPLASPGVGVMDQAIVAGLEKSPYQIQFYTENLDANLTLDESSQRELREWYARKYHGHEPDAILAVGSSPLELVAESQEGFFRDTPVIFCGSTEEMHGIKKLDSRFTGVWGVVEPARTLEAALKLQPGTRHVVVVGGIGEYDRYVEAIAKQSLRVYESRFEFTYLTDLDMPSLRERVAHLPPHTIIYYTSIMEDAAGTEFIDATQSVPLIVEAANAPVFDVDDVDIGRGTVGGYVLSFADQGRMAADLAVRVLEGEKPINIPVVRSSDTYIFDWRTLRRWGFSASNLPPGSILLNRQPTAWELYKGYIIAGVSLFFVEMALIIGLFWEQKTRIKVQHSLRERLRFETVRSELSADFINLPESQIMPVVQRSLARIAEFFEAERVSLYEFSKEGAAFKRAFSWAREGMPSAPDTVNSTEFPWLTSRLLRGEVLFIPDSGSLPDEASAEKGRLVDTGLMLAAALPLAAGGEIIGFMSFATVRRRVPWITNQAEELRVLAEIFSSALRRIRMQTALQESEERFRRMANTAPVLIWMSGPDTLCTYFNKPWLDFTGKTLEAELGDGWSEGVHPEDRPRCLETYRGVFDQREEFRMEYRLRRYDGEYRWIVDIGVPRFNSDGSFAGYIGSAIDITDRRKAEESLASVSRRLIGAQEEERRYIARELHDDICQDLALLAIEVQQLQDALPQSAVVRNQTEQLSRHTQQISNEVQSLSHRLHSSKLEFLGLVAAAKSFCRELGSQHEVDVSFAHSEVPRSLPQEISLCLFRVLQEALRNAVKHSGVKHFEVDLRGMPGAVLLTVRDSGVGFNVERVADTQAGLGLVSMRERVGLAKGVISIASKPQRGTEISVRVPVAADEAASQAVAGDRG
jgi:PAS domain S-box-containing protein